MWEVSICFESPKMAEYFASKINLVIKSCKGISACITLNGQNCVLIAVPKDKEEFAREFVKQKIAECILFFYKKDYIVSKLNFERPKTPYMNVFLQTLVCFDGEADKHLIEQCLDFEDRVFVDAVVAFKLKFLKNKWEELVSLANENVMYFLSEDSLLELIKFLISNLEHRCYAVNVFSKSDCYFLCDLQGKRIDDFMLEKQGIYEDGSLLSTLVALNPEKIIVHCNKFVKDKLLRNLFSLFPNRIEICK